jgi:hypothetical protein
VGVDGMVHITTSLIAFIGEVKGANIKRQYHDGIIL